MKSYNTNQIKNVVLVGNSGSGKTTLGEAMLFEGGVIERRGDVESKSTVSDFKEIEQNNTCSVFSALLYTEFNDHKINILDAPGLDDFIGGVVSSLSVADTALMVINAQNGVEVGAEVHGRYLARASKPIIFVVNHLDHEKVNWEKTIESIRERFGNHAVLAQYPVNPGSGFDAVIDVVTMKMYRYPSGGGKPQIVDIPDDQKDQAAEFHAQLIERAAESDESLMEQFFANDTLTPEEFQKGIKGGLINRGLFPVFCVSAKKNIGTDRLLEFITQVVPSPDELPAVKAGNKEVKCDKSGTPAMFVFKTSMETHIGEINYFKVMSGQISEGMDLVNNTTKNKERIAQIFAVAGKNRNKVPSMVAGDLGATVKLKGTRINHTLSADTSLKFDPIVFPEPKYRTAIKPLSEGDEEKLGEALQRMNYEDPTIRIEYSKELKQIILSGQGEYHMNILKWHMDNIFKIGTEFLLPRIPYRETITKVAQADYRHKKQSGGAGQFGEVHMIIEPYKEGDTKPTMYKIDGKEYKISVRDEEEIPLAWGGKLIYYNCIVGGSIDARFMPAILKGIMEKMEEGPLTGSYARDIRVCVYDGKMHPVDSNEISFRLAGRNAFSQAFKKANPKILEPIYLVEVLVPSDRMGDVMSDLQGRRAIVQGMESEMGFQKITARVPLAEMNKYSTALSSLTGGRAIYTMKFSEYEQVPGNVQDELLKAYEAEQDEE
ncbi:MAG: elongation factor G [Bacteroidales bacterium]|nr:elongation factor G [Bacteroidales bacterium]MBN2761889.1 elongation factor G [Bacteroidales bacterium]